MLVFSIYQQASSRISLLVSSRCTCIWKGFDSKSFNLFLIQSLHCVARWTRKVHYQLCMLCFQFLQPVDKSSQKRNSRKEPFKSSTILKFWWRNVVKYGKYKLANFANFLIIVLRAKIVTIFKPKVVTISARNTIMRKFANFVRLYFAHYTTFSTKFWNFTTFKKFFPRIWVFIYGNCPFSFW